LTFVILKHRFPESNDTLSSMNSEQTSLPFDISKVLLAVEEASQLALELQGHCRVEVKPDATFVTEADKKVELLLRDRLGKLAPDWSFLGEEGGFTGDPNAACWVLDPIDGTNNFVKNLPVWCVSVGAVQDGEPLLGVVAVPPLNEIYWAVPGQGAWRKNAEGTTQLHATGTTELMHEDVVMCNTEADQPMNWSNVTASMRNFGTVAYHLVMAAGGSACAALARCHKLYDVAGGMAICREAGCAEKLLDGRQWKAEPHSGTEYTPLLVAPPNTLKLLSDAFGEWQQ
jgi:fructose-1,6-bisphosphatase/inositol monophosphatase family enzyme